MKTKLVCLTTRLKWINIAITIHLNHKVGCDGHVHELLLGTFWFYGHGDSMVLCSVCYYTRCMYTGCTVV